MRKSTASLLGILAIAMIVSLNWQTILDQYALSSFHPGQDVAAIESRLGLTEKGRAAMYRSRPQIDSKTAFNGDCQTRPHELELGCYWQGRIFVMQIDNQDLAPEMDVVMAHEVLHSVWNNMSKKEKAQIGAELERVYATQSDPELKQRMADYQASEPGEQDNELHSILATEFGSLPPQLEKHYAVYFQERNAIVRTHASYQKIFSSRKTELANELAVIRSMKAQLSSLNSTMDSYRANSMIDQYNALVPRQNKLVNQINSRIDQYQQGVDEYNALSRALDSQQITDTEVPAQ